MHPLLVEDLARERINDLHREAQARRLVRMTQEAKGGRRRLALPRLERAPAH